MNWRTPPSLKWLIVKRSRLSGQLERLAPDLESAKDEFEQLSARVERLKKQLEALDQTFLLHDIQIDPTGIEPVVPHRRQRLLPQGQLGRHIRRLLAERKHSEWVATEEITRAIMEHLGLSEVGGIYQATRKAVRNRLHSLMSAGELERIIGSPTNNETDRGNQSLWRLKCSECAPLGDLS
ncbi:hypothetical protein [Dyella terrae]|uniref:hypothetical protein n=1 Tax=Dyella terrae TaxID=522259 RepID=UPI001EFD5939|nr:hypothetical protein [Dyella terrae]ULU24381.1 hypothetical protein DYST_01297 [Dyella terrae]